MLKFEVKIENASTGIAMDIAKVIETAKEAIQKINAYDKESSIGIRITDDSGRKKFVAEILGNPGHKDDVTMETEGDIAASLSTDHVFIKLEVYDFRNNNAVEDFVDGEAVETLDEVVKSLRLARGIASADDEDAFNYAVGVSK